MNVSVDASSVEVHNYVEVSRHFWTPLCVQLCVLAFSALLTWHSVKSYSGINDINTFERVWKHIKAIRFQPASYPMLLGIFINLGINYTLLLLFENGVLLVVHRFEITPIFLFHALLICPSCISTYSSTVVYRKIGGVNFKRFYLTNLILDIVAPHLFMCLTVLPSMFFFGDGTDWSEFLEYQGFFLQNRYLNLLIKTAVSFPFYLLAVYKNVTPTGPAINGSEMSILEPMKPKGILMLYLIAYFIGTVGVEMYLRLLSTPNCIHAVELVLLDFAIFEFLAATFISIHAINLMFPMEVFRWHWVSFLVPAFWKTVLAIVANFIAEHVSLYVLPDFVLSEETFLIFCENGTYGFLGVWIYLKIMERFSARIASKEAALA